MDELFDIIWEEVSTWKKPTPQNVNSLINSLKNSSYTLTKNTDRPLSVFDLTEKQKAVVEKRFWSKVKRNEETGCLEWHGWIKNKYGRMKVKNNEGIIKDILAHRLSYELYCDKIPEGYYVRHMCSNPICCEPTHLDVGDHQQNMDDMKNSNRSKLCGGGVHKRSKLTPEMVNEIRHDKRDTYIIALSYGISTSYVKSLQRGENWEYISGPMRKARRTLEDL